MDICKDFKRTSFAHGLKSLMIFLMLDKNPRGYKFAEWFLILDTKYFLGVRR
jgi:hypothetical protein